MGYNSENAQRLIFDVETAPLPDAADYLEEPTAPRNYVNRDAISGYKATARAEQLEKAGLDVDLCRVVAIGWLHEGQPEPITLTTHGGTETEDSLLEHFWTYLGNHHLVGFNCISFDLPVLQRRSLYLGVPMPSIAVDKYRHPQVTDLAQMLSYNGMIRLRSLSFYAKRFGIDVEDATSGADIAGLVAAGDWAAVAAHCEADVKKTALVAQKLGVFRLETEPVLPL